jgi:hypothetical protein
MVAPVLKARERAVLGSVRPFVRVTWDGVVWPDGTETHVHVLIWCTGFKPALEHLRPLGIIGPDERIETVGNRCLKVPRFWLLGYGDWTGFASATLIGAARTARAVMREILAELEAHPRSRQVGDHRNISTGILHRRTMVAVVLPTIRLRMRLWP